MTYIKKQRDECVLFLDECFGKRDLPDRLKAEGYLVEPFGLHLKRGDGRPEQSIKDPRVLKFCDSQRWVLVTTDGNMQFTHVEAIKKTELLILATAHNNADDMDNWVTALISLKAKILRLHRKQARPSFVTFSQAGVITSVKHITAEKTTRRHRPGEM